MVFLNHNGNADLRAQQLADSGIVEVRRSRFVSLVSRLARKRRPEADGDESEHFHADRVEDSVHVMIKHEQRHGKPVKGYSPRAPLSVRLLEARKMEAPRQTAVHSTIEAQEDDGQSDVEQKLLAAIVRADCVEKN